MNDGIKTGISQTVADIKEAVVKPVSDEMGKAIEQGVQSVTGSQALDPAVAEKKKQEEAVKKQQLLRCIDWYKQIDSSQAKVRQEQQQKIQEKAQTEQQTMQVKQFEVLEQQKKQAQLTQVEKEARKTELKGGVGG